MPCVFSSPDYDCVCVCVPGRCRVCPLPLPCCRLPCCMPTAAPRRPRCPPAAASAAHDTVTALLNARGGAWRCRCCCGAGACVRGASRTEADEPGARGCGRETSDRGDCAKERRRRCMMKRACVPEDVRGWAGGCWCALVRVRMPPHRCSPFAPRPPAARCAALRAQTRRSSLRAPHTAHEVGDSAHRWRRVIHVMRFHGGELRRAAAAVDLLQCPVCVVVACRLARCCTQLAMLSTPLASMSFRCSVYAVAQVDVPVRGS